VSTPATFTISATGLALYSRCPAAYRMTYVLDRRPVRKSSGLIAGSALHGALAALYHGKDVAAQDAAIDAVLEQTPITPSEKEYRTGPFIKDALAAFRPELASIFAGWTIEECEKQGVVELGTLYSSNGTLRGNYEVRVMLEFRRDLVGVAPWGERWIVDFKSASREEDAQTKAFQNSGQFMGYTVSWRIEHPNKPVVGVLPVRLIMRKPSKTGVAYTLPKDEGVRFSDERLDEWKRHTLRKVREILERAPQDADAWPMAAAELGCCRHVYGCCDFIDVCVLDPKDRALKLSTDEFESAQDAKARSLQ
jgi:PD-(D/E)XK nuclease superfamily